MEQGERSEGTDLPRVLGFLFYPDMWGRGEEMNRERRGSDMNVYLQVPKGAEISPDLSLATHWLPSC